MLVQGLRDAVPYIREHEDHVFVLAFGGEALDEPASFERLIRDIVLIADLGVRLVLVPGARPQINRRFQAAGFEERFHDGLRVTEPEMIDPITEAVGAVQFDVISWLSARLSLASGSGLAQRVLTGNFVTARPIGVIDGVDLGHTGAVRRVDVDGVRDALGDGSIVVQSNIGYSPTGELFNLRAEDVAESMAVALGADKLIFLTDPLDDLPTAMSLAEVEGLLDREGDNLSTEFQLHLHSAVRACSKGVDRIHLVDREVDGALLVELYTRDGCGTLITSEPYERIRPATLDDIGGILALIEPMEQAGGQPGGGAVPDDDLVEASDFVLLHGNGVSDPDRIREMVARTRALPTYRGQPVVFNEDDHYDFEADDNNMLAAVESYAGWGFFDYRRPDEDFDQGYQSVPANWGITSERKRGFFNLLARITGVDHRPGPDGGT
ncbi:MAG: amino-acid N-acetyltransferase, partial [Guyparkeria sp.]